MHSHLSRLSQLVVGAFDGDVDGEVDGEVEGEVDGESVEIVEFTYDNSTTAPSSQWRDKSKRRLRGRAIANTLFLNPRPDAYTPCP